MKIILIFFFIFGIINTSYSEGMVTWGTTGDTCKGFNITSDELKNSEDYQEIVQAEIRAFLTGYNMFIGISEGTADNMKIINQDSSEFIFSYIKNYCKNNNSSAVFLGLVEYFNELK
tara:strand:- start:348 stop:698 length:351 start_codon:yes stop_codon:yes gene_type:complete